MKSLPINQENGAGWSPRACAQATSLHGIAERGFEGSQGIHPLDF
jgi:hypothetical protein